MALNTAPNAALGSKLDGSNPDRATEATASSPHRTATRIPLLTTLFIGLFGVLLASFPARNLDVWKHLADGRNLMRGQGISPTWLYDLATYLVFSLGGGAGLVAVKALVCGAVAVLLFTISRTNQSWRIPLMATGLAVLAMGSRMLLQPATVAVLFLTLSLWLVRREKTQSSKSDGIWPGWRFVVLFAIWANVAGWAVLGLGVVALTWLGRLCDAPRRPEGFGRGAARWAGSVAILIAATCLSPSHINGLRVPPELRTAAVAIVGGSSSGQGAVNSPFDRAYYSEFRNSPAALCYYPLLGLGLLSFLLNRPGWRWEWFLPWLGLAVVSGIQVRTVPFFAVVAGPVLAWNLQEVFARRGELPTLRPRTRYAVLGLTFVLAGTFLLSAWPGWLQVPPYGPRRWAIEPAPLCNVEPSSSSVRTRRGYGQRTPRRFIFPRTRLRSSPGFVRKTSACATSRSLRTCFDRVMPKTGAARLRALGVNRVVVHAADAGSDDVLKLLLADPDEWPILHLTGGLVVFGWRDPARPGGAESFSDWEVDFNRLAFRPDQSEIAPPARPAPSGGGRWWEAFWRSPPPPHPAGRDEATLLLMKAEALWRSAPQRHLIAWEVGQLSGLVAAAGGWTGLNGPPDAALRLTLFQPPIPENARSGGTYPPITQVAFAFHQRFKFERGDVPVGVLYAAVRAARRTVAENPTDANAYLILGQAYARLVGSTVERKWISGLPQLMRIRQVQASAALNRALVLNPKLPQAHLALGLLYPAVGCLDLAANHLRMYRDLTAGSGGPREKDGRAEAIEAELKRLTETVDNQTREFDSRSGRLSVSERATTAFQLGLGGKARDLLLKSDLAAFGAQGVELELDLLLRTGRADEVLEWMTPEVRGSLGDAVYQQFRIQALAAVGEYAAVDTELADVFTQGGGLPEPPEVVAIIGRLIQKTLHDAQPGGSYLPHLAVRTLSQANLQTNLTDMVRMLVRQCEVAVLRGLLALEAGNIDRAQGDVPRRPGVLPQPRRRRAARFPRPSHRAGLSRFDRRPGGHSENDTEGQVTAAQFRLHRSERRAAASSQSPATNSRSSPRHPTPSSPVRRRAGLALRPRSELPAR